LTGLKPIKDEDWSKMENGLMSLEEVRALREKEKDVERDRGSGSESSCSGDSAAEADPGQELM